MFCLIHHQCLAEFFLPKFIIFISHPVHLEYLRVQLSDILIFLTPIFDFKCLLHLAYIEKYISGLDFFPKSLNFNCPFNISSCLSDKTFKTRYAEKKHPIFFPILLVPSTSNFDKCWVNVYISSNKNCWGTFKNYFLHTIPLLAFLFKLSTLCFFPKDSLPSDICTPCSNVSFMTVPKQKTTGWHCPFFFSKFLPLCSYCTRSFYLSSIVCLHWKINVTKAATFFFTIISMMHQHLAYITLL